MINKKILLMILFSFAAHMAVAAVIVYVPSEMTKDMLAGHPDNVIWGYVSGSAEVEGMRQPTLIPDNVLSKDRGNSSDKVIHTEADIKYNQNDLDSNMSKRLTKDDENNPLPPVAMLRSNGNPAPLEKGGKGGFDPALLLAEIDSAKEQNEEPENYSTLSGNSSINIKHGNVGVTSITAGNDNYDMIALAEYVRNEIERQKYYPDIARTKGIEGTVYINFYIGQDGTPGSISIAKSSGEKILDDAGIMTIRKIGKISNLHRELRELDIVVPITYKLE